MQVHEVFDEMSDGYTAKISRWVPFYKEMVTNLVTLLPDDFQPTNILDLGCGNGNITALLLQRYPDAQYALLDASEEMLKACQQRFSVNPDQFSYHHSYFQEADFAKNSFDLVVAGLTIHHLVSAEKQAFFKQLYRWMRPGGIFSCSDLFINKQQEPDHSIHIQRWEADARALGTTDDEWDFVFDHYTNFDRPDSVDDQFQWLQKAGFQAPKLMWQEVNWTTIQTQK